MDNANIQACILESLNEPIVFVDTDHKIRYMNSKARDQYSKWGEISGNSIFKCHNEDSGKLIRECYDRLVKGEEEVLFASNPKQCVYMRAVRDSSGKLIGYYERYAGRVKE
jgi:hypothetical protein